ncbi:PPOX class F420-dependent oxidoreductase [Candidatus Bathyarchaeota archaeon]|nr:PPOX class F420-dependent oxidoreductase [Candidatus Bathyarchaeota archaeon]
MSRFDGENVISVETYRKNGTPVRTPVWFIKEEDRLVVHTGGNSGKVKRIKRNRKVRVAPSKFRGEPKADFVDAQAEIVADPEAVKMYYSLIYKKYGLMGSFTKFVQRFTRSNTEDVLLFIRPV